MGALRPIAGAAIDLVPARAVESPVFGLSFAKVLLLVAVVAFVWFGWRWFQRWELDRRVRDPGNADARTGSRRIEAEDMVACRVCGTYVSSRKPRACARGDCPFPR